MKKAPGKAEAAPAAGPIKIKIGGKEREFDIDNPVLPDWIEENKLTAGGYPYDKKMKSEEMFAGFTVGKGKDRFGRKDQIGRQRREAQRLQGLRQGHERRDVRFRVHRPQRRPHAPASQTGRVDLHSGRQFRASGQTRREFT